MRNEIGMTFAAALKAFLRQDPNIIMVGEIRDLETGGIAIKAALTGHLVLSTLHTNSAPETVTRLLDMGLEPFNVASRAQPRARAATGAPHLPQLQATKYDPAEIAREGDADTTLRSSVHDERSRREGARQRRRRRTSRSHARHDDRRLPFFKGKGCDTCGGTGLQGPPGRLRGHGHDARSCAS